jgi:segregation and condensation protein B
MELSEIIPHIEALIFASDRPLTNLDLVDLINNAFGFMEEKITLDQIETALEGIREKYNSDFYPFEVFQSGGGWQFLSKPAYHTTIAQLNGGKFLKKLSNAAMETLSIIAYKQPITKGEIESIRGVNSDYSVQKLLEKELIVISGRNEELPGKPLIYETSKSFMDYFGLNSTSDLPKIKEVLSEQIEPTQQQRTTEENVDFGIFRKFDEEKQTSDTGNENGENEDNPASDVISAASTATIAASELELSDEQSRESMQEATDDLQQALHPDISDLNAATGTEEAESLDDSTSDEADEELADQEADSILTGNGEDEGLEEEKDDAEDVEDDHEDDAENEDEDEDDEDDDEDEDDDDDDEDEEDGDDEDEDDDDDDEEVDDDEVDDDEDEDDDEEEDEDDDEDDEDDEVDEVEDEDDEVDEDDEDDDDDDDDDEDDEEEDDEDDDDDDDDDKKSH